MNSWEGVFGDLELLSFNVETYLIEPLLRKAMADPNNTDSEEERMTWDLGFGSTWIKYGALIVLLGCLTVTAFNKRQKT